MPDARALLAADRFASSLGVELVHSAPELTQVRMTVAPGHLDFAGRVSAGVLFALADCAMSLISNAEVRAVAVAAHLAGGAGADPPRWLAARATPAREEAGTTVWTVEVEADPGGPLARFVGTTIRVPG